MLKPSALLALLSFTATGSIGQIGPHAASAAPAHLVHAIKVLPDRAPDTSSLKAIVQSVTRGARTNDEKAIAIYNFATLANYHRQYPREEGGIEALKLYNVYGWSLCGGLHSALGALWRAMGWEWRFVGWNNPGHTTVEVNYDGKWHYLDTFLKFYAWKKDAGAPGGRTIASQEDIRRDPTILSGLVLDPVRQVYYQKDNPFDIIRGAANWTAPAFLVCGDEPSSILSGINSSSGSGSPTEWEGIKFDGLYSTDVDLAPGHSLTLNWSAERDAHWWNGPSDLPGHTCKDKDYRNSPTLGPILEPYAAVEGPARSYASGRLIFAPDFRQASVLAGMSAQQNVRWESGKLVPAHTGETASVTIRLQSPYVIARAGGQAAGADSARLSVDHGQTWTSIHLNDFSAEAGGHYDILVQVSFRKALSALTLSAIVQHNRSIAPYLSPGHNAINVTVADPASLGDNRLVVTYAYQTGTRNKSYEEIADRGAELGQGQFTAWSPVVTVVQKAFTSRQLPATFSIDVPTRRGRYPAYPRMLFMRREIVSPGTAPVPLPQGAVQPALSPNDTLQEMPNPFLMGTAPPAPRTARPTITRKMVLTAGAILGMKGDTARPGQELRWYKDSSMAWIMPLIGDMKGLPPSRRIAAARLLVPVLNGHDKAPARLAATALASPLAAGEAYDSSRLGEIVGSVIVDRQPAGTAAYEPPRLFAIDVTRHVKQVAAGSAVFRGYALRIVPDRGIDDGWTVKVRMPDPPAVVLELDLYTDDTGR